MCSSSPTAGTTTWRRRARVYKGLAASMRSVLGSDKPEGYGERELGIIGVLWPSKRFAESDLIPGGAASVGGGAEADDIRKEIDELADFLDRRRRDEARRAAKELVDELETDPAARKEFAELVRDALDGVPRPTRRTRRTEFFAQDGEELMDRLANPSRSARRPPGSLTTGGAAGLGDIARKAYRAARNMLNVGTYYEMKSRAGKVGETGVADLLADLRTENPDLRIHLAGHSFGAARGAAAPAGDDVLPIGSVSLLQAAFSHYSFADNWEAGKDGTFRSVLLTHRISGPMIITYTKNDKAVGVAYAIASRVAGQVASAVGDKDDKYGGLGRNGAQKTPEAVSATLLAVGADGYELQPGKLHNLHADDFISGHGDVEGREVAYAVLSAIAVSYEARCLVTPPEPGGNQRPAACVVPGDTSSITAHGTGNR